jgi:hypothetical protein
MLAKLAQGLNTYKITKCNLIRLKRIYNFWCSMLVYAPFALHFVTLLWHFYAFFRTNQLTRCHNASSLFSDVFVFQKSYTGNILGIGWNKSRSSYFSWHETESKVEMEGGQRAAAPWGGVAYPWLAPLGVVATWPTSWHSPSAYIFFSVRKP